MFTPSSIVHLLANVDISNNYEHTFLLSDRTTQTTFFLGKTVKSFTDFNYIKKEGILKVPANAETLFNCNYLMFQNSNFGTKWFYAFITDINYINEETSAITFEIDVMQTWLYDIDIRRCYVDREHVASDELWEHNIEEDLNSGEYVMNTFKDVTDLNSLSIVVATTCDKAGVDSTGQMYTGVYSGLIYYAFSTASEVNSFISTLDGLGKGSAIQHIFMCPTALMLINSDGRVEAMNLSKTITFNITKNYTSIDGYVPKNKKLFSYPYNYLYVTNYRGAYQIYRYELCNDTDIIFAPQFNFMIKMNVSPNPVVFMTPKEYKGHPTYWNDDYITLSDYPVCNFVNDFYTNWVIQNQVSNALAIAGGGVSIIAGAVTKSAVGVASGILSVAQSIGNFYEKNILPNPARGQCSGASNVASGTQTFGVYGKTIKAEYAKMIDDYFTRFGYKVNSLKIPELFSRPYWNYVKCHEANIVGDIPNKDLRKINDNFVKGITFWHGDNVGNYTLNNAI